MTEVKPRTTGIRRKGRILWTTGLPSLLTCLWYALPDYVPSRNRRAAAKTVLLAAVGLYGARLGREVPADEGGLGVAMQQPSSAAQPAVQGLLVVTVLVGLTAGAVVAERFMYRAAEGLAERGVSHPHTKVGLTMGLLTPLTQRGTEFLWGNNASPSRA